jgi:hypothetical protein
MLKTLKTAAMAAAIACVSLPATAQEEPRTTYQIVLLSMNNAQQGRWLEIMSDHIVPARAAAGLPTQTVHWMMAGPWNIMLITEMPGGLASLDVHQTARDDAYDAALLGQMGSQEAVDALNEEMSGIVRASQRTFSHTHP